MPDIDKIGRDLIQAHKAPDEIYREAMQRLLQKNRVLNTVRSSIAKLTTRYEEIAKTSFSGIVVEPLYASTASFPMTRIYPLLNLSFKHQGVIPADLVVLARGRNDEIGAYRLIPPDTQDDIARIIWDEANPGMECFYRSIHPNAIDTTTFDKWHRKLYEDKKIRNNYGHILVLNRDAPLQLEVDASPNRDEFEAMMALSKMIGLDNDPERFCTFVSNGFNLSHLS